MNCKLFALLMLHVFTQAECQQPMVRFSREGPDLNTIRFTCTTSGGSPINNAFFRRDGMLLNNQAAENYDYQLSPDNEGDFTCEQGIGGVRSEVLQLGGRSVVIDSPSLLLLNCVCVEAYIITQAIHVMH